MLREFISLEIFNRQWDDLGLTENDMRDLEEFLCISPHSGSVIPGTGGVRKLRWAIGSKGKRGGIRVLYIDFIIHRKIYLLTAYSKSKKDGISDNDKKTIRKLVKELKKESGKNNEEKA